MFFWKILHILLWSFLWFVAIHWPWVRPNRGKWRWRKSHKGPGKLTPVRCSSSSSLSKPGSRSQNRKNGVTPGWTGTIIHFKIPLFSLPLQKRTRAIFFLHFFFTVGSPTCVQPYVPSTSMPTTIEAANSSATSMPTTIGAANSSATSGQPITRTTPRSAAAPEVASSLSMVFALVVAIAVRSAFAV